MTFEEWLGGNEGMLNDDDRNALHLAWDAATLAERERAGRALAYPRLILESVPLDDATVKAKLWQGEAIPRAIRMIDDYLNGESDAL